MVRNYASGTAGKGNSKIHEVIKPEERKKKTE